MRQAWLILALGAGARADARPTAVEVRTFQFRAATIDNILGIYAMLRSLAQQRVSPKMLGGPLAIPQMAYGAAASSWMRRDIFDWPKRRSSKWIGTYAKL